MICVCFSRDGYGCSPSGDPRGLDEALCLSWQLKDPFFQVKLMGGWFLLEGVADAAEATAGGFSFLALNAVPPPHALGNQGVFKTKP